MSPVGMVGRFMQHNANWILVNVVANALLYLSFMVLVSMMLLCFIPIKSIIGLTLSLGHAAIFIVICEVLPTWRRYWTFTYPSILLIDIFWWKNKRLFKGAAVTVAYLFFVIHVFVTNEPQNQPMITLTGRIPKPLCSLEEKSNEFKGYLDSVYWPLHKKILYD